MRSLGLLVPAALLAPAAHAQESLLAADLEAVVDHAETAFGQGDEEAFRVACDGLTVQVTRLSEPVSPAQAARVHACMALCSYSAQVIRPGATEEDIKNAVTPFVRAARTADPRAGLGEGARQDGASPLTRYFAAATREPAPGPAFPDLGWGRVLVDGRESRTLPADTPAVVQRACGEGSFGPSRYLQAGASVPDWERCPMKPGTARHIALGAGTGLLAAAAVGFELGAAYTYSAIQDDSTPAETLIGLRDQNRIYNYALWGALAGTVGLGATLAITW